MDYFNQLVTSLTTKVGQLLPGILGAILVLVIGLIIAWIVRQLVLAMFSKTKIDEKLNTRFNASFRLDRFVARLAYFLVLIYVLVLVLDMMGIQGVLAPLSNMLNEFLSVLPNVVAAIIIGFAGYVVATLASEATGFLALSLQNISNKAGLKGSLSLERLVKQLVFIFVFIPILIAALDALNIKTISEPATLMFNDFLKAIPQILGAAAILAVFYFAGKYIVALLEDLLNSLGLDKFSAAIGFNTITNSNLSLSKITSNVAFFFLMFGGIIAASEKLNLNAFTTVLRDVFDIAGSIFFGIIVLLLGNYLSNLAKRYISQSEDSQWLGSLARFAVLFIFLALGLHTMGIAEDIVNLAFGVSIGAIGIAFALAFGLGGREAAGKYAERFLEKFK